MKRRSSMFLALGVLFVAGCSQAPAPDRKAAAKTLRDGEIAAYASDWAGRDANRIASHYSEKGELMIPNVPVMSGREAIVKTMKDALADPNWSLVLHPVEVEVSASGDLGYTRGTYVLTASAAPSRGVAIEEGRFLTVFAREEDRSWRVIEQISNADGPALIMSTGDPSHHH